MGLGWRDQGGGGVEGGDLITEVGKGFCVSAGTAAGVQDLRLIRESGKEPLVQRLHVDFDSVRKNTEAGCGLDKMSILDICCNLLINVEGCSRGRGDQERG